MVFLLGSVARAAGVARLALQQPLQQLALAMEPAGFFFPRLQDGLQLLDQALEALQPLVQLGLFLLVLRAVRLDRVCRPLQLVQVLAALLLQHLSSRRACLVALGFSLQ